MALSLNGTSGISGIDGSAGTPALQGSDTNTGISFGADTVNINTGGTTRATVDSSGRVLVGTGTSRGQFFGGGASSAVQGEVVQGSGNVNLSLTGNGGGASMIFAGTGAASGGDITALSANAEIGYIDFQAADGTNFRRGARIAAVTEGAVTSTSSPSRIVFETAPTGSATPVERMRINKDGVISIGKTNVAAAGTGIVIEPAGYIYTTIASSNTYHVYSSASNTFRFYVNENGGIYNYSANNVNLCDEREKKNIVSLDSTWDCLKHWQLKKFHYNEDADSDDLRYGVIAQQIAAHCPEVISDWVKQKAEDAVLDEDGNVVIPAKEEVVRMAVKEQQMMWMAIKALQEAQLRIEQLETRLTALEGGAAQ